MSLVVIAFHVAMICGAPWGHLTMGGRWPGALPPAARWLSLARGVGAVESVLSRVAGEPPVLVPPG